MTYAAYSDLKAAWHIDRIAAMRKKERVAPVELQLIMSDLCNQDCYFCAYRAEEGLSSQQFVEYEEDGTRNHNPNRMIPREKILEILNDAAAAGVQSVIFTGGGEPSVHPHHLEMYRHALDLGLQCSLNTNGLLLRRGWEDVLPRFTYVRVSVDAGSPEDYAKVRRVPEAQYEKVLGNLTRLAELCAPAGCTVGTGFVVTPTNYQNLIRGVKRIRDTGAQYVRLASMQSTEQFAPFREIAQEIAEVRAGAAMLETNAFRVVDLFDVALGKKAEAPLCGMQHFVLYIGGNQKIYRCCYTAFSEIGEIGNLTNRTFADWLKDEAAGRDLYEFDARDCDICPLEHKNKTIRYMVDPAPAHVSFV